MTDFDARCRGYAAIGLYQPKHDSNVGGAMRAAACFGVSLVAIQGKRFYRYASDTPKAYRKLPVIETDDLFNVIPYDCIPIAVELAEGADDLRRFYHPRRAFYIFGAEDGGVPRQVLHRCRDVVYIPTARSLNLAATVNVVLYDRLAKQ